jgi:hypothetical protein
MPGVPAQLEESKKQALDGQQIGTVINAWNDTITTQASQFHAMGDKTNKLETGLYKIRSDMTTI